MNKIINFCYKIIHGPYPCGRTKENSYLCCTRKASEWNTYLTKDKTELRCIFCDSIKISSNHPINKKYPLTWE